MADLVTVDINAAGYENIYFYCPHCKYENIINRASDLQTGAPVSGMEVVCQNLTCGKTIWLKGDRSQIAHYHWFLQELPVLRDKKLYRDYVLNLCQGAESFFLQAIYNKEFDRNIKYRNGNGRTMLHEYLNDMIKYEKAIKPLAFNGMRSKFLKIFSDEHNQPTARISVLKEDKRDWAFSTVENSKINILRNQVAHKHAYRPKLSDISEYDDLIKAIYWLGAYLHVLDSNYARSRPID